MGKDKRVVKGGTAVGLTRRVSRSTFAAAVDAGVRSAGKGLFDIISRDDIEHMKQTATVMDVNTWQCRGSCGCPMANLGVVTVSTEPSGVGAGAVASAFAGGYDRYMSGHGIRGAAVLQIED